MEKRLHYPIAIFLSSLSMGFGLSREFLLVAMLGFTNRNDELQLYLSVFYTVGLSIDAMRLSCLNLCNIISLPKLLLYSSIICIPFVCLIVCCIYVTTTELNLILMVITAIGCYLNLIAALLITYKQKYNHFLAATLINVMPNLLLIPGIIISYLVFPKNLIFCIMCITSLIPLVQITVLLTLKTNAISACANLNFVSCLKIFLRHFTAVFSEQIFQILTRAAFYKYAIGFLSLYALAVRIYASLRFILIDTMIASRLSQWHEKRHSTKHYTNILLNQGVVIFFLLVSFVLGFYHSKNLTVNILQMGFIFSVGFYLSTIVRVLYFKMNVIEGNHSLIMQYVACEVASVVLLLLWMQQINYSLMIILWIGYIAKPFSQLQILRKRINIIEKSVIPT